MEAERPRTLTGSLGVRSIVFMVVAAAAPLTVVAASVPLGISLGDGAAYPATFVICCVILLLFAVGFCAMTRFVPNAGAFYTYVQQGLGRIPGLGAAFLALGTYTAVQLAVYGYIGAALQSVVVYYGGPSLPWQLYAFTVLAIVALLGYRHIELSSKVLGVFLVRESGIVLVFDAVVNVRGGAHGLSTALLKPAQITSGSLGIGIMFSIASFLGFEATSVFRATKPGTRTAPCRAPPTSLVIEALLAAFFIAGVVMAAARRGAGRAVPGRSDSTPREQEELV